MITLCRFQWNHFLNIFHAVPPPTVVITPSPFSPVEGWSLHIFTLCLWRHAVRTSVFPPDISPHPKTLTSSLCISFLEELLAFWFVICLSIRGCYTFPSSAISLRAGIHNLLIFVVHMKLSHKPPLYRPVNSSSIFSSLPGLRICSSFHN